MKYLATKKPKRYRLEYYMGCFVLKEKISVDTDFYVDASKWVIFHREFLEDEKED